MKKILAIATVLILILTMSGCDWEEKREEAAQKEAIATEILEKHLEKYYPDFNMLSAKNEIFSDSGGFTHTVSSITEFEVSGENTIYHFYYDCETEAILSDVNYDNVNEEFRNLVNATEELSHVKHSDIDLSYHNTKALLDGHTTLKEVNQYAREQNDNEYSGTVNVKFENIDYFAPENFEIINLYDNINFPTYILFSNNNTKNSTTGIIRYSLNDEKEIEIRFDNAADVIKIDAVSCYYNKACMNLTIEKSRNPISENFKDETTGKSYLSLNVGYDIQAKITRGEHTNAGLYEKNALQTNNGIPAHILYANGNSIYFKTPKTSVGLTLHCETAGFQNRASLYDIDEIMNFEITIPENKNSINDTVSFLIDTSSST